MQVIILLVGVYSTDLHLQSIVLAYPYLWSLLTVR